MQSVILIFPAMSKIVSCQIDKLLNTDRLALAFVKVLRFRIFPNAPLKTVSLHGGRTIREVTLRMNRNLACWRSACPIFAGPPIGHALQFGRKSVEKCERNRNI